MPESPQTQSSTRFVLIGVGILIGACILVSIAFMPRAYRTFRQTRIFRMAGESMEPTLYEGDRVAVDTTYYPDHPIADGDIIVFHHGNVVLAKRVSAIAGETIAAKDGKLVRNGVPLAEPYLKSSDEPPVATGPAFDEENFASRLVPPDQVFVTGDWRSRSLDSRASEYAPVRTTDIIGKVIYIYFSSHPGQQGRHF